MEEESKGADGGITRCPEKDLRIIREGGLLLPRQWHALSPVKHSKHIHCVLCSSSVRRTNISQLKEPS